MVKSSDPAYVQKLARAEHHFKRLDFVLEAFVDAHTCPVEEKIYPKSKQRVWRISGPPPNPDVIWSPLFGEFFFNARSALDQLIWAVVRNAKGSNPNTRLLYPIYTDPISFMYEMREPLKALPADVLTIVERSQPYNGPVTPERHSLSLLNKLCNIDKHRRPILTIYSTQAFATVSAVDFDLWETGIQPHIGPVKEGTVLLAIPQDMEMSYSPTFDICFAEGEASYTRARDVLLMIVNSVRRIINDLQPFAQ